MTNAAKAKGDRAELEAVRELVARAPDLALPTAQRKLGAGRRLDVGDLDVFADTTVQVKNMKDLPTAIREAAAGAQIQAERAGTPFALGMVPIPRARATAVRWLAVAYEWPGGRPPADEIAMFSMTSRAVTHVQNEGIGVPRRRRIAVVQRSDLRDVIVAPIEAWLDAYRGEVWP